jgi:hypothetical protein
LRSSVRPARAHTLVHLLPLVASSGVRKQIFTCGLGITHTILLYGTEEEAHSKEQA